MIGRDKQLEDFMTVGKLRQKIKDLPEDAPVFIERIQDSYFELGTGWMENAVLKPAEGHPEQSYIYVQAYGAVRYSDDDALYLTPHY